MSRSADNLSIACETLGAQKPSVLVTYQGDVSERDELLALHDFLSEGIGLPDIVINNSGGPSMGSFLDHDDKAWQQAFDQGFMAMVRLTRSFSKNMIDKGWGRFVSISSSVAIEPSSTMVLSASMRAGLAAFSKSASLTLAETGVTFNTICPGGVATDRLLDLVKVQADSRGVSLDEVLKESQNSIPMKRFADPKELADLAVFLASEKADYITGRVHVIDGGLTKSY